MSTLEASWRLDLLDPKNIERQLAAEAMRQAEEWQGLMIYA